MSAYRKKKNSKHPCIHQICHILIFCHVCFRSLSLQEEKYVFQINLTPPPHPLYPSLILPPPPTPQGIIDLILAFIMPMCFLRGLFPTYFCVSKRYRIFFHLFWLYINYVLYVSFSYLCNFLFSSLRFIHFDICLTYFHCCIVFHQMNISQCNLWLINGYLSCFQLFYY